MVLQTTTIRDDVSPPPAPPSNPAQTWREMYGRSLPSAARAAEQRQQFFQQRIAQRVRQQRIESRQAAAAAAAATLRRRAVEDGRVAKFGAPPSSVVRFSLHKLGRPRSAGR